MPTIPTRLAPSPQLYSTVRGILIANGTTLSDWCKENGLLRQSVEKALKGEWRGHKADKTLDLVFSDILGTLVAA